MAMWGRFPPGLRRARTFPDAESLARGGKAGPTFRPAQIEGSPACPRGASLPLPRLECFLYRPRCRRFGAYRGTVWLRGNRGTTKRNKPTLSCSNHNAKGSTGKGYRGVSEVGG